MNEPEERLHAKVALAIDTIPVPAGPGGLRPAGRSALIPGAVALAAGLALLAAVGLGLASLRERSAASPDRSPRAISTLPTVVRPATPSPSVEATPAAGRGPRFSFGPGPVEFCGPFVSFSAPRSPAIGSLGSLVIGGTTFMIPDRADYYVQSGLDAGTWVCITGGQAAASETVANLLVAFKLAVAPSGTFPRTLSASVCGTVDEAFIGDLPSGGYVTLSGARFQVGGMRRSADESVGLPPQEALLPGVEACIVGATLQSYGGRGADAREADGRSFYVIGGRVLVTQAAVAPLVPHTERVRWIVRGDTMYVQPEAPDNVPTTAEEVRLVADDGSTAASAPVRAARPGEPRTCGIPAVPMIAALAVSQDVIDQFAPQGTPLQPRQPTYHFEVREGPNWRIVAMLDWRTLPEGPCYQ